MWELLTRLKDVQMDKAREKQEASKASGVKGDHLAYLRSIYSQYLPLVQQARKRIGPMHEVKELGTLAVFHKTAGELHMLAQDYEGGEAVRHAPCAFPSSTRPARSLEPEPKPAIEREPEPDSRPSARRYGSSTRSTTLTARRSSRVATC